MEPFNSIPSFYSNLLLLIFMIDSIIVIAVPSYIFVILLNHSIQNVSVYLLFSISICILVEYRQIMGGLLRLLLITFGLG